MKAVRFNAAIPHYVLGKALGNFIPEILWGGLSCTYAEDIPRPELPTPEWLRIRTRLGGVCGTDTGNIHLHTSPYYSPFSSFPFTIGHENVGTISELGPQTEGDWAIGERVVVDPLLWCAPRGFRDTCEFCARGEVNRCQRTTEGSLAPGPMTGTCRDTGGSWSAEFVAHPSQLYRVPASVSDENALMVEPFSIGLHAALLHLPEDGDSVLIVGAGTIGLTTLAALRALGSKARILVLARYPFQAEAARRLGASDVLETMDADPYTWVAERTGGVVRQPILGRRVVSGGADQTFECVGSDPAIDEAMRFTRDGGTMILVGVPGIARGIDWTALFAQELTVVAARNYHNVEAWHGRSWEAFDLAFHLMESGKVDLGWMVTHRYAIDDFKQALRDAGSRRRSEMIKAVFDFGSTTG